MIKDNNAYFLYFLNSVLVKFIQLNSILAVFKTCNAVYTQSSTSVPLIS